MSTSRRLWYADLANVAVTQIECHPSTHVYGIGRYTSPSVPDKVLVEDMDLFHSEPHAQKRVRAVVMAEYAPALVRMMKLRNL